MATDFGSDFSCISDIGGNLELVSGTRAVAEAVARRWMTPPGGLFYDPDYGYGLLLVLHGEVQSPEVIGVGLENEALKDERVLAASVAVSFLGDELVVKGKLTTADGPFRFTFTLTNGVASLVLEEA